MANENEPLLEGQTVEEPTSPDTNNGIQEQQPETPKYLTEADWIERETRLRNELAQQISESERRAQAKADKARDNAVRKTKQFVQDYVPALKEAGIDLDSEVVSKVSEVIQKRQFWEEPTESEQSPESTGETVTLSMLQDYLRANGLSPNAMNLSGYVGLRSDDPRGSQFYGEVRNLVEAQKQAAIQKGMAQRKADAQKVAQVKSDFGTTATPAGTGGQASTAQSLEEEFQKLLKTATGDMVERANNKNRMNEIEKELKRLGRWS